MKRWLFIVTATILLWSVSDAQAYHIPTWNHEYRVFKNTYCAQNNTCDLEWFSLLREDFAITREGLLNYGTRAFLEYQTDSAESLTNYGIVKFIRGCVFESYQAEGKVVKIRKWGKWQFGLAFRFFNFPNWVIDSIDEDPMYPSRMKVEGEPEEVVKNRHYFYRWSPQGFHDSKGVKFLGEGGFPPYPRLYVRDISAAAFLWDATFREAENVSLELRSCIYKTADIPRKTTEDNIDFAKPIHCFSWNSSFLYNHDLERFETKDDLDPLCLEELKENPTFNE